jgi:phage host-nuclease inhibitor protein Gam
MIWAGRPRVKGATGGKGIGVSTELLTPVAARGRVAEKLRRIVALQARLDGLQAELEGQVADVHRRYDRRIAALRDRSTRLMQELEQTCRAERDGLFPPGRKTLSTPFGDVGFRRSEPAIRLSPDATQSEVCRRLGEARLDDLVRTTEAPDKPALRRAIKQGRLAAAELGRFGLELTGGGERFYCRLGEPGRNAGRGGARR